jgi:hypothetical protein
MKCDVFKDKVEQLRKLGYDVDHMTVSEIIAVCEVLERDN